MNNKVTEKISDSAKDTYSLRSLIAKDTGLQADVEKFQLFQSYAGLFEEDLKDNLGRNSIELDETYQTKNPSSWREFLRYKTVKDYIAGFVDEIAEKKADSTLGSQGEMNVGEAIRTKNMLSGKVEDEPNKNIIVVFLPQKDYNF